MGNIFYIDGHVAGTNGWYARFLDPGQSYYGDWASFGGDASIDNFVGTGSLQFDPNALADDGSPSFDPIVVDESPPSDFVIDPLVLNLAGSSVATTALNQNGVSFDMRGDGNTETTGWIAAGEGFLVVDKDHSGQVNSSRDMINDLNELTSYDSNGDGKITAADAQFAQLQVWTPGAQGSAGTLQSLSQLGISEVDLAATSVSQSDNGNQINSTFQFVYADGTTGQGADVTFAAGPESARMIAFSQGQGTATLSGTEWGANGNGVLAFGAGITPTDIAVTGDAANNLTISVDPTDNVVLQGALSGLVSSYGVQTITFINGAVMTTSQVLAMADTGSTSNLALYGDAGANTFDSKGIASYEQGNGGGDTFQFNQGYGQLQINEADSTATPANRLVLGTGIDQSAVAVSAGGPADQDVILTIGTNGDRIDLTNMRLAPQFGVQEVDFADGTVWARDHLLDLATAAANSAASATAAANASTAALLQAIATSATTLPPPDFTCNVAVSGAYTPLPSLTPPPPPFTPTMPNLILPPPP